MFCFKWNSKKDLFLIFSNIQLKFEYKKVKKNMSIIGNHKPKNVYYGYSNEISPNDIIQGLNSLCQTEIHIAISKNPTRLVLSYVNITKESKIIKGDTFHIFNITYKDVNEIIDITQYDIYNAIQDYIYIYKIEPSNNNIMVSI
jgi:hypothetical protein